MERCPLPTISKGERQSRRTEGWAHSSLLKDARFCCIVHSADKKALLWPYAWAATARACAEDIAERGGAARQLHATILRFGWPALRAALPVLFRLNFATQRAFFHRQVVTCPEAGELGGRRCWASMLKTPPIQSALLRLVLEI